MTLSLGVTLSPLTSNTPSPRSESKSIPLLTPRKVSVLEPLYVFITNLQAFLVKLQLILFA